MRPKVLVLTGYGINCDYETEFAFQLAGAHAQRVHLNDIIADRAQLKEFQIMAIPGGFSFGDDIASGKVLANKLKYNLSAELERFIDDGKPIIGICNGFQVMVRLGLLPAFDRDYGAQVTSLTFNDSGRFEARWVYLKVNHDSPCIFTRGMDRIYLPLRSGEGKFIPQGEEVRQRLWRNQHVVLQYVDNEGGAGGYPWNPNGSIDNIAGLCDETGRVFGLMPHPEAFAFRTNHPRWTREHLREGEGLAIFRNAVRWVSDNL
jgi:phosphoribosylformylglycinamidine synthase I